MKLAQLLAQHLEDWPRDTKYITQDLAHNLLTHRSLYVQSNQLPLSPYLTRAEDWESAWVTREAWESAKLEGPPELLTLEGAPLGTLAPATGGGAWCRIAKGWKWNGPHGNGSTSPRPGPDWDGRLIEPAP